MNYSQILEQAKEGNLDQQTILAIANELASKQHIADSYTLLHILGRAEATQYEHLIRHYLDFEDDPMLVALALRILCQYWNLTDKYVSVLIKHINGHEWDIENYTQIMAISIAGEYLHHGGKNKKILRAILSQHRDSHIKIVRNVTYDALCRAIGFDHLAIIEEMKRYKNTHKANSEIINRVNQMLETE